MDRPAQRNSSSSLNGINSSSGGNFGNMESENIRVYLRIRPFVEREEPFGAESGLQRRATSIVQVLDLGAASDGIHGTSVRISNPRSLGSSLSAVSPVNIASLAEGETFTFDAVGSFEVTQEDVFQAVAKPITENCLQGYNGTIFAYGQTGSGKTFTMQGPVNEDGSIDYDQRGLIPRTFEYLFERMREEERQSSGTVSYLCKCTYVEIYNECIYDLLDSDGSACTLREDVRKGGVYVEGCREAILQEPRDAFLMFEQGSRNRHVAETAMNRESSRSHCVFTLFIQSRKLDGAILDVREARFNLVDLAGSERQQFSNTAGARLKEAGNINKSLLALSNVINALVDIANGKPRHVHYRDSRLTFLLRDSLGGNAKTLIIAAASPSALCQAETLSTLRFAQRAKQIRNKAVVNKDVQGNVMELQAEVRRLRSEILILKATAAGSGTGMPSALDGLSLESFTRGSSGDGYRLLGMALERQNELLVELATQKKQMEVLEELVRRKEQQANSEKMVAKFREGTIKALQAKLNGQEGGEFVDIFEPERMQYRAELAELRKQIDHHPEVTRFAFENIQLRERLRRLEQYKDVESVEMSLAKHRRYQEALGQRLLVVEREREELQQKVLQLTEMKGDTSDDDVPVQPVRDSTESILLVGKSTDTLIEGDDADESNDGCKGRNAMVTWKEYERLGHEKDDLEARYEDLIVEQEELRRELSELRQKFGNDDEQQPYDKEQSSIVLDSSGKRRRKVGSSRDSLDATFESQDWQSIGAKGEEFEEQIPSSDGLVGKDDSSLEELALMQETLNAKILALQEENTTLKYSISDIGKAAREESKTAEILAEDLATLRGEYQEKVTQTGEELSKATIRLEVALNDRSALDGERELLEEEVLKLKDRLANTEVQYQKITETLRNREEELGRDEQRIEQLEQNITELIEKLSQFDKLRSFGGSAEEILDRLMKDDERQSLLEQQIQTLESLVATAEADKEHLSSQLKALELSTDDKAKLVAAETKATNLQNEMEELCEELLKLRRENDKLIQHTNMKQKLQYHLQIKEENNAFREEIRQLREELTRLTQRNLDLEEMIRSMRINTGQHSENTFSHNGGGLGSSFTIGTDRGGGGGGGGGRQHIPHNAAPTKTSE